MQLVHYVEEEENFVKWTSDDNNILSTYNLKFKDVTKIKELLSTVDGLSRMPSAAIQTSLPAVANQSTPKNFVAKEEKKVDHSSHSEMAVEGPPHNLELLAAEINENTAQISGILQHMVFEDNIAQTNMAVDDEAENSAAHSGSNVNLDTSVDLVGTSEVQQESSKDNIRSENETANTVTGNELLPCSETESDQIIPISHIGPDHLVNTPADLSLTFNPQHVSILCT